VSFQTVRGVPIGLSERTLVVCPIPRERSSKGPIKDFRGLYPLDYVYMIKGGKSKMKLEDPSSVMHELGSYVITDFGDQKVCWICIHMAYDARYDMASIEAIIESMAEEGLHEEFDMAFPLLGSYDRDGVDSYDVGLLIKHYFGGSPKIIDIHVDY